tara:strand:- start:939 stop:1811 length:873 start_codon:yes stop_codon:yes gene_type:complete
MSQHDYSVANDTGANVRADLNNALQALASISSGASAPSTTYAYQWWGDTTNSVLKRRNANNSGWIVVRTLSESFVLTKTTAYTVVLADFAKTILCDASGGAFTVTLPAAATAGDGYKVTVKKSDSSANAVTVDGNSSETIDGATTKALSSQYDAIVLACDGSNWHLVADNAGGVSLNTAQNWTKGQRGEITGLSDGATITPDMDDSNNFSVTLGGNRTLANPSNLTAGQTGSIYVTQDGTGSRTLSYGTYWDFAGGSAPTLTTTAAAVDRIDYAVRTTTSIHAVATLAYS